MRRVLYLILTAVISVTLLASAAHAAGDTPTAEGRTVRVIIPVAYYNSDQDVQSGYMNYTMEYLHEISQRTGWQYEIIKVPGEYSSGVQTGLEMLRNGEADLVAPIRTSEDIGDDVALSRNSYVTSMTILQVPNSVYDGLDLCSNLKVAFLEGSRLLAAADEYFDRCGVEPEYICCGSIDEQIQAGTGGDADVMLNSKLEYIPNMSVVAEFAPEQLFFAAVDQQLLNELDKALV